MMPRRKAARVEMRRMNEEEPVEEREGGQRCICGMGLLRLTGRSYLAGEEVEGLLR